MFKPEYHTRNVGSSPPSGLINGDRRCCSCGCSSVRFNRWLCCRGSTGCRNPNESIWLPCVSFSLPFAPRSFPCIPFPFLPRCGFPLALCASWLAAAQSRQAVLLSARGTLPSCCMLSRRRSAALLLALPCWSQGPACLLCCHASCSPPPLFFGASQLDVSWTLDSKVAVLLQRCSRNSLFLLWPYQDYGRVTQVIILRSLEWFIAWNHAIVGAGNLQVHWVLNCACEFWHWFSRSSF